MNTLKCRRLPRSLPAVMLTLLLTSAVLAASSPNYDISWYQFEAAGSESLASTSYTLSSASAGQGMAGDLQSSSYLLHAGYQQDFTLPTNTPTITPTPPPGATDTPTPTPGVTGTPTPTDCPNPFVDISGNIFYGAIHYLYCRGVVNGVDSTHFNPTGTSTRGQFAKVVVLGFGIAPYTPTIPDFTDVPPGYFAYAYIEAGYHAAILAGFTPAQCQAAGLVYPCYQPNLAITRGQLTKLVVGAAHYPLITPVGGNPTYNDVPANNVFYLYIETAHYKNVVNGYPDGSFRPNNPIQRDQMCQIVYKGVTTP